MITVSWNDGINNVIMSQWVTIAIIAGLTICFCAWCAFKAGKP